MEAKWGFSIWKHYKCVLLQGDLYFQLMSHAEHVHSGHAVNFARPFPTTVSSGFKFVFKQTREAKDTASNNSKILELSVISAIKTKPQPNK